MIKNIIIGILVLVVIYLSYTIFSPHKKETTIKITHSKTYTYVNQEYGFSVELPEYIKELKNEDGILRLGSDSDDGHIQVELKKGGIREMVWNPFNESISTVNRNDGGPIIVKMIDRANGSPELIYKYAFITNAFKPNSMEYDYDQTVLVFEKFISSLNDVSKNPDFKNPDLVLKDYQMDEIAKSLKIIKIN